MYNKLFTKILDSSIWLEPTSTRIVWITLLAAMDADGYAHFSAIENLAIRARVTKEEAEKAIECFVSPDPNSANPENEGRRVERVTGGFYVLNAAEHRNTMNREIQREQTRIRTAKWRERKKGDGNGHTTVTHTSPTVTPASASVFVSKEGKESVREKETILEGLRTNPAYEGIDVEREFHKMEAWCKANHKIPSHRRLVNWLNNAEKPLVKAQARPIATRIPGDAPANPNESDFWNQLTAEQQNALIKTT